ncbi:hypothetical protein V7201_04900 [Bacillus sp. JJ1122]|uniref:hypothetical protein n=1 Tax=Bacillus sp. JJ1122 TaxID=3122951 RepID=UPI002FFF8778
MRSGIEKKQILGILTDMIQNLEVADANLQDTLTGIRSDMCIAQTERLEKIELVLDGLEKNVSAYKYSNAPLITDTKGLKLELGF